MKKFFHIKLNAKDICGDKEELWEVQYYKSDGEGNRARVNHRYFDEKRVMMMIRKKRVLETSTELFVSIFFLGFLIIVYVCFKRDA